MNFQEPRLALSDYETQTTDPLSKLIVEPFLHEGGDCVYNPIRNTTLTSEDNAFEWLKGIITGRYEVHDLSEIMVAELTKQGWLVRDTLDLAARFYLKYVSLEAHSACNQACYFCPVSTDPRHIEYMPLDLYETIVKQLSMYRRTIEAVFMHNYNEPTVDKRLVELMGILKAYKLPIAMNTNASGLSPARVDQILELGGIDYMSVNLSTMNAERYKQDRGSNQLPTIIRNLDYLKNTHLAKRMDMAVLGRGDATHRGDFETISAYFKESRFNVRYFVTNDRSGKSHERTETECFSKKSLRLRADGIPPVTAHSYYRKRRMCLMLPGLFRGACDWRFNQPTAGRCTDGRSNIGVATLDLWH